MTVTGPWRAVAVGEYHSCALNTAGHIKCWGSNRSGETDAPEGVYTAIAAAFDSCALRADGTVTCWGRGEQRESKPVPVNTRQLHFAIGGRERVRCNY